MKRIREKKRERENCTLPIKLISLCVYLKDGMIPIQINCNINSNQDAIERKLMGDGLISYF